MAQDSERLLMPASTTYHDLKVASGLWLPRRLKVWSVTGAFESAPFCKALDNSR